MASLRTTKSSNVYNGEEAKIQRRTDSSEDIMESDDVYISDIEHDDQDGELEETQSKSAEELLSTMVAGVSSNHYISNTTSY
jgi:hypothetical protein